MKGFALAQKISLFLLGALLLAPAVVGKVAAPAAAAVLSSSLNEPGSGSKAAPAEVQLFARELIQTLGEQEGFGAWKQSVVAIDPLGPGTHGWLVSLMSSDRTPVGYLIIGAKPEGGLALIEYGNGSDPLYNPKRLSLSGQNNLVPMYGGPTLTQWRVFNKQGKTPAVYYEAAGGEPLPDTDADWLGRRNGFPVPESSGTVALERVGLKNKQVVHLPFPVPARQSTGLFRPDDNLLWMTGEPLKLSPSQFAAPGSTEVSPDVPNQPDKWVFFSSGASRTYAQSLPISGYQLWQTGTANETKARPIVYCISQSENLARYISLDALTKAGEFRAWTGH
ncbi:hypothetical protein AWM70_04340 [Paenibacillus yonginensis]|uniref:Uncharacterized protein n=1 Tax=Paenibacillus yonginensis TaxID=1462996 RepID=A0A1B1MXK4_9BACL|nr:hypothetical protein [Paenibacillus yonginensis]ANS73896.1 hypothetical protein AWM70_04340 [Paenibacillus yonginensis]